MNKEQAEIKNTMGQLEASMDIAGKHMDEVAFSAYCDNIYAAISKLRVQLNNLQKE